MTMREKLARAIAHAEHPELSEAQIADPEVRRYLRHADAALAAMREPTEAMIDAVMYARHPAPGDRDLIVADYRTAIDAAQTEEPATR